MGNSQSAHYREGGSAVASTVACSDTTQSNQENEAIVTTYRPGHLYSHTLSLGASPGLAQKASKSDTAPLDANHERKPIVAGSAFARYGGSDSSLADPSSKDSSDVDSSASFSGSDAASQDLSHERSEIFVRRAAGRNLEINTDQSSHVPLSTPDVQTPRAPTTTHESANMTLTPRPDQSDDKEQRRLRPQSLLFGEEDQPQAEDTMRTESKEPDSDDEAASRRPVKTKLSSLPSYLKIPTTIPRSFTTSKMVLDPDMRRKTSRHSSYVSTPQHQRRLDHAHMRSDADDHAREHPWSSPDPKSHSGSSLCLPRTQTAPHRLHAMGKEPLTLELVSDSSADIPVSIEKPAPASPITPNLPDVPHTPVNLIWRGRGKHVFVTGTFADEWQSKIPLKQLRPHTPFLCTVYLPPGTHRLKFVVDDRWRVSSDLDTATDGDGTLVNYVEIPNLMNDSRDHMSRGNVVRDETWKRAMAVLTSAHASPRGEWDELNDDFPGQSETTWTREVPACIELAQEAEENILERDDFEPGDDSSLLPRPPQLPRQLEKVILNAGVAHNQVPINTNAALVDDNSVLPAPNHAVLNHLATGAIKNGVLAMGTVTRYKNKYITTVLYRPVHA